MDVCAPLLITAMLACGGDEAAERLRLDPPGEPFLSEKGLRLPLGDSTFVLIEAALVEWRANPALPETARYALRAGIGVRLEF
ncbi:MAG TPA: hypothetical protein VFC18_05620 [Burkholderiales bacterium]|nr:hypothetical protein [Burkholderiales bacterium]